MKNNITEVSKLLGIEESISEYGHTKAKISLDVLARKQKRGKLILVTATSPTPLGEGKTTISISLSDALNKLGKKALLSLREPSLGPVFGLKGGATGGGKAILVPSDEINLHFTGDFHAITSANNLLASLIDNHIYHGNELGIAKVTFKRCIDVNDRQLRVIETGLSSEKNIVPREDGFDITAASEIMAILCLSKDIADLKRRLGNIVVGYDSKGNEITARMLKAEGAMTVLLKDAISPNLVTTAEGNPAIVHGGPFANIAHGCSSIIATNMALSLGDYAITEAGFGSDLGAEKFLSIKAPLISHYPDAVVLVTTIRSLKYHGGLSKEELDRLDIKSLEKGLSNLYKHYDNLKQVYSLNVIVAINHFSSDYDEEINYLINKLAANNIPYSVTTGYRDGSPGSIDLAQKVIDIAETKTNFTPVYRNTDDIKTKIYKVATSIYGAKDVEYQEDALEKIATLESHGHANLPICIAKTQYSLSDDPKNLDPKGEYNIHVRDVILKNGAEFIVVLTSTIMTMPGLPKVPNSEKIDIVNGEIKGIF